MRIFNKSAKPIFTCALPKSFSEERVDVIYNQLISRLKDYYILVYTDNSINSIKFECFNCEINEIEFNELKEKLYKTVINNESNFRI